MLRDDLTMGFLARMDKRNQRTAEELNELLRGDDWVERSDERLGATGRAVAKYNGVKAALLCAAVFLGLAVTLFRWIF
jgi:hypothetical protein